MNLARGSALFLQPRLAVRERAAVPTLSTIEEGCERKEVTLVVHPAIRRAMQGYEDSFYIGCGVF